MTDAHDGEVLEVKKYPNRRFYDATRKKHVTLADLYEQVRTGRQIHVTDSKSGDDITHIVLTQIILEHDPPKLELFPASLLHQTIQANQQVVRGFIDQYFARAVNAFVDSQQRFEDFMRQAGRAFISPTAPMDWARNIMSGGFAARPPTGEPAAPPPPPPPSPSVPPAQEAASNDAVKQLQAQLDALTAELRELRSAQAKSTSRATRRKP